MKHAFKVGAPVKVENGRVEVLYSGTVADVVGSKISVKLPAAAFNRGTGWRCAVFDLADPSVSFDAGAIYASW